VNGATNVAELKKRVSEQDPQWEVARQRIIFQGRELDDTDVLSQSGLDNEVPCVHLVMRLQQGATTRRSARREDPAKRAVAKPAVKVEQAAEPVAESLSDQVYGGLEDSGRFTLDEALGELRWPPVPKRFWPFSGTPRSRAPPPTRAKARDPNRCGGRAGGSAGGAAFRPP